MRAAYRADHVGSLLRPPELLETWSAGSANSERRAREDSHILRVLARQQELGFGVFTDGELRRRNFMSDFTDAVEGFDLGDDVARSWRTGATTAPGASAVAGIVTAQASRGPAPDRARAAVPQGPQPRADQDDAPERHAVPRDFLEARHQRRGLRGPLALLWDMVEIMKSELQVLADEGVELHPDRRAALQLLRGPEVARLDRGGDAITARGAARGVDPSRQRLPRSRAPARRHPGHAPVPGEQPQSLVRRRWLRRDRGAAVRQLEGRSLPARIRRRAVGGLRAAAVRSARQGRRTRPRQHASCRNSRMRHALARRIDEAARHVALENLALSPQCGFASTMEGNLLTEEEQWAKLRLVAETARRVWG